MSLDRHIILIGPMGAGKSTIGRLLSHQLNLPFIDLDRDIEARAGASIPWIFDIEGEDGFRERETQALVSALDDQPSVIATGGGCILRESNRNLLRAGGVVALLVASVQQQLTRTAKDKGRPLLEADDVEKVLLKLAAERNPLYQETADFTVDTNGKPPKLCAFEIIEQLEKGNENTNG